MDLSKFKTADWLMIGGGALFLIAGFLPWFSFGGLATQTAFNFFFTGTLPWLLVVAVGVFAFLAAADIFKLPDNLPVPTIFLGATALSTLLVLLRLIIGYRFGGVTGAGFDRGIGLFLGLIAAGVATAGAYMNFTASGGDLKQLAGDLQSKAQSATSGSSSSAEQAPPPPSDAPPPPSDEPPPDAPPPPNQ